MSGAIGGTSGGYAGLTRLIADSGAVRRQYNALIRQAGSGLIANTYAGLGGGAATSLSLHPRIAALKTWRDGIDAAEGRAQVTQAAMTRVQGIAADLVARLTGLNGLNPTTIDSMAANARAALAEVGNALNSQYAGAYVFAGEDIANPPVPNADQLATSGFFTQIAAAVGTLSGAGAAGVAAATLAVASSNSADTSPFSVFLSRPAGTFAPPLIATGEGRTEAVGLLASANTGVPSTGASTTGSHMRDLLRALATVGSLSSGQVNNPGFAALVEDTRASVSGAVSAMAADAGILGEKQSTLRAGQTRLRDTETALTAQVSGAEDVDMAEILSSLSLTQTRLQASYQLISASNGLSLVKFLGGG